MSRGPSSGEEPSFDTLALGNPGVAVAMLVSTSLSADARYSLSKALLRSSRELDGLAVQVILKGKQEVYSHGIRRCDDSKCGM